MLDLLSYANIKPAVNQVELHPGLTQVPLVQFHQDHDIQTISYGPLMKGEVFKEPLLTPLLEISNAYQKSIAQVIIAWGLQRGLMMIPKSKTQARILENYEAQALKLSDETIERITKLNRGKRLYSDPDNNTWGIVNDEL